MEHAGPDVQDMLPVSALRERCATVERELLAKKTTPEAIDPWRPGSDSNPDQGVYGWHKFQIRLERMHALAEVGRDLSSPSVSRPDEVDDVLAAALADEPIQVRCTDAGVHKVYPKSYHALRYLDFLDALLQLQAAQARAIAVAESTSSGERRALIYKPLLESFATRLWLWIITSEDPGLPFDEDADEPAPPEWTTQVTPYELTHFLAAHHQVNARRLAVLSASFPADPSAGGRLTIAGFLGTFAHETGRKPRDLMRHWSLGSVFASAVAAHDTNTKARKAAEQRAGRSR